ncbi:MAG: type II toxin-antitoxin system prevent-host-death family antitoxin [Planctomycetes bacterium]|nr:type II toxin-antitoxin system prevent-host-death family antitoxin [Planctomycetota bacterium]
MKIAAGEFKAKCLRLLEEVRAHGTEIVITKRGRPVARLVPYRQPKPRAVFGSMKGSVEIVGDIVAHVDETWEAER